jgi:hypothetical protein
MLVNLEDLNLNRTPFRLNSSKRLSMNILNKFNVPHIEILDLPKDKETAFHLS